MNTVSLDEAADLLLEGKIGVLPTDTVYGVVARASDKAAVTRLYNLKNRENKPGTLIAASVGQLTELGFPTSELERASKYWPGAVSVVMPLHGKDYLTQDIQSLAARVVDVPKLQDLLTKTGPLITSSANPPGLKTASQISEAYDYFLTQIDFYVDGGQNRSNISSTVIKFESNQLVKLRQGSVIVD
jgi:L-threonylcarbamoyladenylate synthase